MKRNWAIFQMYYGNRGYFEEIENTEENMALARKASALETALREKLAVSPELLALYDQTANAYGEASSDLCGIYYAEGFRFGFLMGLDIAGGSDEKED